MSARRAHPLFVLISVLGLLAASCGSGEEVVAGPSDETGTSASFREPINEQDVDFARAAFDAAKRNWENTEPFAYTLSSGVESINLIEIDVDAEGNASTVRVVQGEEQPEGWSYVPRTVGEAFDELDAILTNFESGEWSTGSPGGCDGSYFNASFDPEFGVPHYYDTLGPCDDGVGIRITVTPDGRATPAPEEDPFCETDPLVGTWQSPRAADTEPLDPDDGIADEGGSGVVNLTLVESGESTLLSADTIEIIGEWFCRDSTVIAISMDGEERQLATVNDDGTLTYGSWALTKALG